MDSVIVQWTPQKKTTHTDSYEWEKIDLTWWRLNIYQNFNVIWLIGGIYLATIYFLKNWMKYRKPFDLKGPLFYWNAILAFLSTICVLRVLPGLIEIYKNEGFIKFNCVRGELSNTLAFWSFIFTVMKILELGDTLFLLLRKKQLIFLHWFHHFTALLGGFFLFTRFEPYLAYGSMVNAIVHSIMYSYFAINALGIKLPKMISICLTITQLIQFLYMISVTIFVFFHQRFGGQCESTSQTQFVVVSYLGSYFILFLIFFRDSYLNNIKKIKKVL